MNIEEAYNKLDTQAKEQLLVASFNHGLDEFLQLLIVKITQEMSSLGAYEDKDMFYTEYKMLQSGKDLVKTMRSFLLTLRNKAQGEPGK